MHRDGDTASDGGRNIFWLHRTILDVRELFAAKSCRNRRAQNYFCNIYGRNGIQHVHCAQKKWRVRCTVYIMPRTKSEIFPHVSVRRDGRLVQWQLPAAHFFGVPRQFPSSFRGRMRWWKNSLPPCSSGTLWKQSCWSCVTGQCSDWEWNISLPLPHRMRVQSSFYYQQWIDTWRSRFELKTDSILLAHWSKRRKSQRSWTHWLLCTTSSAICAQCMEEASRRGILGWY